MGSCSDCGESIANVLWLELTYYTLRLGTAFVVIINIHPVLGPFCHQIPPILQHLPEFGLIRGILRKLEREADNCNWLHCYRLGRNLSTRCGFRNVSKSEGNVTGNRGSGLALGENERLSRTVSLVYISGFVST